MDNYIACLKKFADFNGRARRREYWMFQLFNGLIILLASAIGFGIWAATGSDGAVILYAIVVGLYFLAIIVPSLAVIVRRLHDTDRSGAWYFISFVPYVGGIILFVFMCLDSTPGQNRFGPNPKGVDAQGLRQVFE